MQDNNHEAWAKRTPKLQNNVPGLRKDLDPIRNLSIQRKIKNKALKALLKQIKNIDDVVLSNIGESMEGLVTCEYVRLASFMAKSAADNLKLLLGMPVRIP